MADVVKRELVYLWFYASVQFWQIVWYWALGMALGSFVSVFGKERIHALFASLRHRRLGVLGIIPASLLGIASPLCMYGTVPLAASLAEQGMEEDWLVAFMVSSILLNPQLLFYSAALGPFLLGARFMFCFLCGAAAGLCIRLFFKKKPFFAFAACTGRANRDVESCMFLRWLFNVGRNLKATGPYVLAGVALSALFQRYMPQEAFGRLFGGGAGFAVLMAATAGVPLYVCGGGTIPLLQVWLQNGMSAGGAVAFIITGPAFKITNLGALKIALRGRHFALYCVFVVLFALASGFAVNAVVSG